MKNHIAVGLFLLDYFIFGTHDIIKNDYIFNLDQSMYQLMADLLVLLFGLCIGSEVPPHPGHFYSQRHFEAPDVL